MRPLFLEMKRNPGNAIPNEFEHSKSLVLSYCYPLLPVQDPATESADFILKPWRANQEYLGIEVSDCTGMALGDWSSNQLRNRRHAEFVLPSDASCYVWVGGDLISIRVT